MLTFSGRHWERYRALPFSRLRVWLFGFLVARRFVLARFPGVTVQLAAGIQTSPLVSSVRTSKGRRPCLAAVARQARIAAKSWAPVRVRVHPGTFCLTLTMRLSRSAALLSDGA